MTKRFRLEINTKLQHEEKVIFFELSDNVTNEEIKKEVEKYFYTYCYYFVSEIK
ncbi:hypothetical protein [Enterococcus hirae]|uniref:hypothetical protein n=1 Tax=Enterococcus hirae TaxID=1354 RepID=UPI001372F89A|nr:hypothetical protein [Enterococcus hirae]MCK6147490.1 hypothetical protein [Enterococcus hirae]MCK6175236.1 hypothetical protein [Enterococcus hirae]NBA19297.1 hypothetical protein [Enterococcus hirae]NBA28491.1 hypothetical protein [Enterococcus hirae]NBA35096.1 hypothetical protein [Enterococcus hirae]